MKPQEQEILKIKEDKRGYPGRTQSSTREESYHFWLGYPRE